MSEYSDFVESRKAQKDSEYQAFVKSSLAQKQKIPSNAAVAASSAVKAAASIPDMFINAAPQLVGLGLAGTGFVGHNVADLADKVGASKIANYYRSLADLADKGLDNFAYSPSVVNRTARAALPIADPATESQRVMDWGVQTATGALMNPAAGAKGMALNALKLGAAGTVGGVVAEKTGSPIAGIAASIAAPMAASAVGSRLSRIPQSVTQNGRENVAGRQLLNSVADPQKAITALENAPRPTVSRPKNAKGEYLETPTGATTGQVVAQATGDTGILKAEDVMRQRPGVADEINQRYAANAEARRQQLLRMMRDPDSAPNVVKMARDEINNLAQKQAQMANEAARQQQTSMLNLGTTTSADDAAQRLANVADPILAQKQKDISNAFESVDPFNEVTALRIPMQKIEGVLQTNYGGLSLAQDSKVRQAIKLINEAAGQNKAAKDIPELAMAKPTVPPLPKFDPKQVNPQIDDMLTAIAKYGGLNRDYALSVGIDPKMLNQRAAGALVPFPKNGGLSGDEMATRLAQDGYPVGNLGAEDIWQFNEALDNAMRGYKVLTPQGHELQMARQQAQKDLELFNENLKLNPDLLGSTMTYKQMQTIQSRIGQLQREAIKSGSSVDAKTLLELKKLIRGTMDDEVKRGVVPADIAESYKKAIGLKADFESRYGSAPISDLRFKGYERHSQNLATLPKKLVSTREGLDSFKKAFGSEAEARQALSDRLATTFRESVLIPSTGGTKSGWQEAAIKWQNANKLALDEFPNLRAAVSDAIRKSKTVDEMAARFEQDTKKMLSSGGRLFDNQKDPSAVIDSFLASKSRLADSQFIVKMANDSPQFKTSLRGAIAEKVSGMTNAQMIEFIENKANRELIRGLFGDTVLKKFDRVLIDAKRDAISTGGTNSATYGRGATDKIMNQSVWKLDTAGGTLGAALGALLGGGVMGTVGAAAGGASTAHLVKMMNMKQNATTAKAMLDPKYGAELLKKQLAPTPYKANSLGALMKYAAPSTIPSQDKGNK